MLNDVLVATTAVSSFNNAALLSPLFLSVGILTGPLFFIVYLYGKDFVSKLGWNNQNAELYSGGLSALFLMLWLLFFGGNYAVIRDSMSVLPLILGVVLFFCMIVVSNDIIQFKFFDKLCKSKLKWLMLFLILLGTVLSSMMTWWGILLQVSAVLCGAIIGCRLKRNHSWVSMVSWIFGIMAVLILMQPEYFRFGQLGHLTMAHLFMVVLTGFFAITTLITRYVKAHAAIHQSAFVKLKWLLRIVALLALILFVSTESVPVFIGLLMSIGLLEALSIYHNTKTADNMFRQSWAALIICLGVMIICPVISAIGIIYLTFVSNKVKIKDFLRLL